VGLCFRMASTGHAFSRLFAVVVAGLQNRAFGVFVFAEVGGPILAHEAKAGIGSEAGRTAVKRHHVFSKKEGYS